MRKLSCLAIFVLIAFSSFAQGSNASAVEMADTLRSNGKIYTVVAVCLTILFGLFIYLFTLERRLAKWEKNNAQ
jgi:hypothetical protein